MLHGAGVTDREPFTVGNTPVFSVRVLDSHGAGAPRENFHRMVTPTAGPRWGYGVWQHSDGVTDCRLFSAVYTPGVFLSVGLTVSQSRLPQFLFGCCDLMSGSAIFVFRLLSDSVSRSSDFTEIWAVLGCFPLQCHFHGAVTLTTTIMASVAVGHRVLGGSG